MGCTVNPSKVKVWMLMEFAGILHGKKRRTLMRELERRHQNNEVETHVESILFSAETAYPGDKHSRRRYIKELLKHWEKTIHPISLFGHSRMIF
jgi:hypothetical protein